MSTSLIDLNGRVRNRAREQRRRRVALVLKMAAALVVLGGVAWVAVASPLFSVRQVLVSGNKLVPTDAIVSAAAIPVGQPLAQVDAAAISKRVSAIPGLGQASVGVALPSTVKIQVAERVPVFVVAVGNAFTWIDPTGVRFHDSPDRPAGVPLALANADDQRLLADVAAVVNALPARLSGKTEKISAQTQDSITIHLSGGQAVVWGSAEQSSLKGQVVDSLLANQGGCRTIDVTAPAHPTTRC